MFISENFPEIAPVNWLYSITNGGIIYSLIMILAQIIVPFFVIYLIVKQKNS